MTSTALALTLYIGWTLALLLVMETIRAVLVLTKQVASNDFTPDNARLSPFMQRLARAHANCLEGFPIFGGLMLVALLTDSMAITDPLAYWLLAARITQSSVHLASTSVIAVNTRFTAFAVQMAIATIWTWQLARLMMSL